MTSNENSEVITSDEEVNSFKSIVKMTLNNMINLRNRLKRRELMSNTILIYYSI